MIPGTIGIAAAEQARFTQFFQDLHALEKPANTKVIYSYGIDVVKNRNSIVEQADGNWLLMIDDDQVFHSGTLMKLLAHDKDVIAPLILQRLHPYASVAYKFIEGVRTSVLMNGLQEVDAVGTGMFLMKRKVWETVGKFRCGEETISEDLDYCARIKGAGFSIFCDFSLPVGHLTTVAIWPRSNGKVGLQNYTKTHAVDR